MIILIIPLKDPIDNFLKDHIDNFLKDPIDNSFKKIPLIIPSILASSELCGYSVQSLSPVGPFYDREELGYRNAFKSPEKYLSGGQYLQSPANGFGKYFI